MLWEMAAAGSRRVLSEPETKAPATAPAATQTK